jgi:hypothetical protein
MVAPAFRPCSFTRSKTLPRKRVQKKLSREESEGIMYLIALETRNWIMEQGSESQFLR